MAFSFWKQDDKFLAELASYLQGKSVLEIYAGNGLLASRLAELGVNIRPTSLFRDYDRSAEKLYADVEELSATDAIEKYGNQADVLLMSWPEVSNSAVISTIRFFKTNNGHEKKVIFIGERTNLKEEEFGGCANDLFFKCYRSPEKTFKYKGNRIEVAEVLGCPDDDIVLLISTIFNIN